MSCDNLCYVVKRKQTRQWRIIDFFGWAKSNGFGMFLAGSGHVGTINKYGILSCFFLSGKTLVTWLLRRKCCSAPPKFLLKKCVDSTCMGICKNGLKKTLYNGKHVLFDARHRWAEKFEWTQNADDISNILSLPFYDRVSLAEHAGNKWFDRQKVSRKEIKVNPWTLNYDGVWQ